MKLAALVVAVVLIIGICVLANMFVGNPVSRILASNAAQKYLDTNFKNTDCNIKNVGYSFKTGSYYARIESKSSVDCHFFICYDSFGHFLNCDYSSSVASGYNTALRLSNEYRDRVVPILKTVVKNGDVNGRLLFDDVYNNGISISQLEIDGTYDVMLFGMMAGSLSVYVDSDEPTVETAAQVLLDIKRAMDESGATFAYISLNVRASEDHRSSIYVTDFLRENIYKDGLAERVQWAIDNAGAVEDEANAGDDETVYPEDANDFSAVDESARMISSFRNVYNNGEFYADYGDNQIKLKFIDFETMTSKVICTTADCRHNGYRNVCPAMCLLNHPAVIGSKLYGFETFCDSDINGELTYSVNVWQANPDGSMLVMLDKIPDIYISEYKDAIVIGTCIYFIGTQMQFENLATTGYEKNYFCGYDFKTKEFTNYGLLYEGKNGGVDIEGEYCGSLYIGACYLTVENTFDFFNATQEEIDEYYANFKPYTEDDMVYENWRFDLNTKKILPSDMPVIKSVGFVQDGLYSFLNDSKKLEIIDSEGNTRVYDDFNYTGGSPVNGMIFNFSDMTVLNISSGEVKNLNSEHFSTLSNAVAYCNGSYIFDNGRKDFFKVAEDKLILD